MVADGSMICPVCGVSELRRVRGPVDAGTGSRSTMVTPSFEYERCDACGESLIPADRIDELTAAAIEVERSDDGLLSGAEIRESRLSLGLTQDGMERLLGVGAGTVGRWERGSHAQSRTADTLLRLLASHPELIPETGFIAAEGRGPYGRHDTRA